MGRENHRMGLWDNFFSRYKSMRIPFNAAVVNTVNQLGLPNLFVVFIDLFTLCNAGGLSNSF